MNASTSERIIFAAFMIVVFAWRAWETFRQQGSVRGRTTMQWSFYLLFAMSCVIFGGTVLEFFLVNRSYHPVAAVAGVVLFVVANIVRMMAIRTLGRYWSLHIEIREEHQFVEEGVYSVVRHPAYLSFVMEHIAVPLVGNAWWSLLVTVVGYIPLLWLRIMREDKALVGKFGGPYRVYQQEVRALWPRWSVLWRLDKLSRHAP